MANEGIRFAQSAIDRFIQFKMIQLQQQRDDERNRRFDLSLQQNRRFNQERIDIAKETNRIRAAQPRTTSISVFSPGQSEDIRDFVGGSFADATRDTSGRRLIFKDKPDTISTEETERIIQDIKTRAGFDFLSPAKQQQFQAEIDSIIETGFEDEEGFNIQFERLQETGLSSTETSTPSTGIQQTNRAFKGAPAGMTFPFTPKSERKTAITPTSTPTTTFQSGRVRVKHPDGRMGNIPRSQLEDAISQGFREQ